MYPLHPFENTSVSNFVLQTEPYPHKVFVALRMFVWVPLLIFYSSLRFLTVHKNAVCTVCLYKTTVLYLLVRAYWTRVTFHSPLAV